MKTTKKAKSKKKEKSILGKRMREEFQAQGITGYRISKETDLNEATVARFMRGDGEPTLAHAEKLLKMLGWHVVDEKGNKQ